jgi:hypothetical protein
MPRKVKQDKWFEMDSEEDFKILCSECGHRAGLHQWISALCSDGCKCGGFEMDTLESCVEEMRLEGND